MKVGWVIAVTWPLLGAPALAAGKKAEQPCQPQKAGDVPGSVQDTLREEAAGGTVEELCKKGDKGAEIYRAEILKDGKAMELDVNPAGKVVKRGKPHDERGEHERGDE